MVWSVLDRGDWGIVDLQLKAFLGFLSRLGEQEFSRQSEVVMRRQEASQGAQAYSWVVQLGMHSALGCRIVVKHQVYMDRNRMIKMTMIQELGNTE